MIKQIIASPYDRWLTSPTEHIPITIDWNEQDLYEGYVVYNIDGTFVLEDELKDYAEQFKASMEDWQGNEIFDANIYYKFGTDYVFEDELEEYIEFVYGRPRPIEDLY